MISVLIVDDHPVVREGLGAVLGDEPDFEVVGEAESAERALIEVERLRPLLVVMDVRLPGMNGIDACELITVRFPGTKVVMLTSFPNDAAAIRSFSAGARGFILKDSDPAILREAVRKVGAGGIFTDPRFASRVIGASGEATPFGLTVQELRVLEYLPRGFTNADIGEELGISRNTVKTHVHNALKKLKARDRVEAAAIAMREGLA